MIQNLAIKMERFHIVLVSIVLGAKNLSYVKSIETHARAFLTPNIISVGTVFSNITFSDLYSEQPKSIKYQI